MKTLLLTIFFTLNLFALSASNIQESYKELNHIIDEIVEIALLSDTVVGLTLSLFIGLLIGSLLSRKLSQYKRDALSQNIIRDLEDEQTNLVNQITYIETQNEDQYLKIEKKLLYLENENKILSGENLKLKNQLSELQKSHESVIVNLNKKINKAVEDKETLFRQIEETIIF
ncbi:MAG: hypothetical protein L3J19_00780 [Sulfurimonas sp.]|nr:hypothetical protein [Sulfurimonas sp.]